MTTQARKTRDSARAGRGKAPQYLTDERGRRTAVLLSIAEYERLLALAEAEERRARLDRLLAEAPVGDLPDERELELIEALEARGYRS